MKNNILHSFIFILFFITHQGWSQGQLDDQIEYEALKILYEATDGDNWDDNSGWPAMGNWLVSVDDVDMDDWEGITYSYSDIRKIVLKDNGLTGTIPAGISALTELRTLDLRENTLSGHIPNTIGDLTKLTHLYLSDNSLTGSIPISIGNLVNISYLKLENNGLNGTIPETIGTLGQNSGSVYIYSNTGLMPRGLPRYKIVCVANTYLFFCCERMPLGLPRGRSLE